MFEKYAHNSLLLMAGIAALLSTAIISCAKAPDLDAIDDHLKQFDSLGTRGQDSFQQPREGSFSKVDLLFVMDSSGTLDTLRGQIVSGIQNFIDKIPAGTDIQLAALLAHQGSAGGKLFQRGSERVVLSSSAQSIAEIKSDLGTKMASGLPSEEISDGGEAAFHSLFHLLQADSLATAKAQGFFRGDAQLVVVFISDENEICSQTYLAGKGISFEGDNVNPFQEGPANASYCQDNISHTKIYSELKRVQAGKPLVVASLIYTGENPVPDQLEFEIGYGYKELTQLASGVLVDIANPDPSNINPDPARIAAGLQKIGLESSKSLSLSKTFALSHTKVIAESIIITVDGEIVDFDYNAETNEVSLKDAGHAESKIEIHYVYAD